MSIRVRPRKLLGFILLPMTGGLLALKAPSLPIPVRSSEKGLVTFHTHPPSLPQELGPAWASLQKEAREALDIDFPVKPTGPPQPLWGGVIMKTSSPWVSAGAPGRPSFIGFVNGLGYVIVLDHGNKTYTVYGLLDDVLVHNLEHITKGQVIGLAHAEKNNQEYRVYFAVQGKTPEWNQYLKGDSRSWVNR